MRTVYLDNNATTPVAPSVFEAMRPYFTEFYGNPSSPHHMGDKPASAVRDARARVAAFLGCTDAEVVFTSCGTESNNIALRGVLDAAKGHHVVTTAVEHSAVMNPVKRLGSAGYEVTVLAVDRGGRVNLDELRDSLRDDTAIVSTMFANNETGVIFPIDRIAEIVHERGVLLHVDCVQGVGKVPIDLKTLGADLVSFSAHKFHGPKGVGALVVKKGTRWAPVFLGGGQERNRRPGTENVAGIVAMAAADARSRTSHTRRPKPVACATGTELLGGFRIRSSSRRSGCPTPEPGFPGLTATRSWCCWMKSAFAFRPGRPKVGAGCPACPGRHGLSPEEAGSSLRFRSPR
jgi:cysteine desulfurase